MINIKDYYTERLINGNIVRVFTKEDNQRYIRDLRKTEGQDKIGKGNITQQNKRKYQKYKKSKK
tara:strand:- start:522 stop:713 length:192 start_codon:yes stop_codon:yes gene_type:complete